MPIYTYENKHPDQHCAYCLGGYQVMQKMADPAFNHCSYCGNAVKKVIKAVNLQGKITRSPNSTLSEENIAKNDFTQYRKVGKGKYEKTSGKGPNQITSEDL